MFHASMASSYIRIASVMWDGSEYWVLRDFSPFASAIFIDDYLVWSEKDGDKVQNYWGYLCENPLDVLLELEGK